MTKQAGRPYLLLSAAALRRAAEAGMCQAETAALVGMSLATLKSRLTRDPELRRVWDEGTRLAKHRAAQAQRRPLRCERRFHLNLAADLAARILARAEAADVTPHAIITAAIEAHVGL